MELIYIYIDKYRTFEKQEISFSNRFNVNYDSQTKVLSIEENEDYVNIYPHNIVNINGILGKNASGKSSLISLIGDQIRDRTDSEIVSNSPKNSYQIFPKVETANGATINFENDYFLLFYVDNDEDENPIFVFETNHPSKYKKIFDNKEDLFINKDEIYCDGCGLFSVVFKVEQDLNKYLCDTCNFNSINICIDYHCNIINFHRPKYINFFNSESKIEEDKDSIKRREALLESEFYKNKIKFLINQMNMNSSKSLIYKNKEYSLNLKFFNRSSYEFEDENGKKVSVTNIIKDFNNFDLKEFEESEKIVLAFLFLYVWYVLNYVNAEDDLKPIIHKLSEMQIENKYASYEDIKNMYHNQIACLFSTINNNLPMLDEFLKCENALESFLKNAKKNKISYSYAEFELKIIFNKDSTFDLLEDFFDLFVDEREQKGEVQEPSIMNNFLEVYIPRMSEGEQENLALFTSIDEQISAIPFKKNFILLFDEIERSMHPDMCRRLISNLIDLLQKYHGKEFQIIIASHSPFIAGDLLQENIVCLSREDDKSFVSNMTEKPFAQNIHTILKSQFFLTSFIGEYARKCIDKIIKCLNYEKIDEVKNELNEFLCSDKESTQEVIDSANKAKKYIEYVIDSIGEPIIRNELHRRLSIAKWLSAEEKIQYYQNKIKELEESLND